MSAIQQLNVFEDFLECQQRMSHVTLQYTATHCNTLQHTAAHSTIKCFWILFVQPHAWALLQHIATHCSKLQHIAQPYNALHHTASHCNTLQYTATHRTPFQFIFISLLRQPNWPHSCKHITRVIYIYIYTHKYINKCISTNVCICLHVYI